MAELKKAIESRRTFYTISDDSPVADSQIKTLIDNALLHVPSAYNSQSARLVLLLGKHHKKLWELVKRALREKSGESAEEKAAPKIDSCFKSGYGTILFFEDQATVKGFQNMFPAYADNFAIWSQHTSAMHQYAMWMMLEEAGLGASLQHYNPLLDEYVAAEWGIDPQWKLIAQMPFGTPTAQPGPKEHKPLEERRLFFG